MAVLDTITRYAAVVIAVFTGVYNVSLLVLGVVLARRADGSLRGQLRPARGRRPVALPAGWSVFVLVPCLNEERVIANTLRCLLEGQPGVRIVVDDGSDDATARLARAVGGGRLTLVRRTPPGGARAPPSTPGCARCASTPGGRAWTRGGCWCVCWTPTGG
ncbi:hypothetical protein SMD11_0060 [Streptomyces albireticuli]|uniref:Glycosyltransferase 2-like domain-containing protein n=1 Tax=Streptomyces albireticuli TaxID=1940 RepID=A0A1Z2KUJ8_9ACTN|nr:glycosyltransferase [Streptomyces albireticuli]ARZ65728.1 hypothetical protein SMD11_0060 [Streptomyces albireticuli]